MKDTRPHILLTGGTGFLAREMMTGLKELGQVETLARSEQADIAVDLSASFSLKCSPFDWVIHAGGKAHVVPQNAEEEAAFYTVNEQGTQNLCRALEASGIPSFFVFISTVAVYGSQSQTAVTETAQTAPDTPYGQSKLKAERFLQAWCDEHGVRLAILRLPLIAGVQPPGNLGDMIDAMKKGRYVSIHGGRARRSCVLASAIPELLPALHAHPGVYHLRHAPDPSFRDFERSIERAHDGAKSRGDIPLWLARSIAHTVGWLPGFPLSPLRLKKMTDDFTISDEKAREVLKWKGAWDPQSISL